MTDDDYPVGEHPDIDRYTFDRDRARLELRAIPIASNPFLEPYRYGTIDLTDNAEYMAILRSMLGLADKPSAPPVPEVPRPTDAELAVYGVGPTRIGYPKPTPPALADALDPPINPYAPIERPPIRMWDRQFNYLGRWGGKTFVDQVVGCHYSYGDPARLPGAFGMFDMRTDTRVALNRILFGTPYPPRPWSEMHTYQPVDPMVSIADGPVFDMADLVLGDRGGAYATWDGTGPSIIIGPEDDTPVWPMYELTSKPDTTRFEDRLKAAVAGEPDPEHPHDLAFWLVTAIIIAAVLSAVYIIIATAAW